MIPKKIHYCWFGKAQKSELVKNCIATWRKCLPDYEIIEWNENNCDIDSSCEFVQTAYKEKKWAYVSDYFRLKALNDYGGVYLDTDVEVVKSFDELLGNEFFCCFESEGYLCTAVLGCCKGNKIIGGFLNSYIGRVFEEVPNSKLLYDYIFNSGKVNIENVVDLGGKQIVFTHDYFSPKDFYTKKINETDNTYAIHHFDGTWKGPGKKIKDKFQNFLIKLLGKEKYFKLKYKFKK